MKKHINILICSFLCLSLTLFMNTQTVSATTTPSSTIYYYNDGSYDIETIETFSNDIATYSTSQTKSASKKLEHYEHNTLCWVAKLNATFSYDQKNATCISSSSTVKIYQDRWTVSKKETIENSNFVYLILKIKHGSSTIERSLFMSCSNTGVIC